jgi:hypothetical protein
VKGGKKIQQKLWLREIIDDAIKKNSKPFSAFARPKIDPFSLKN